MYRLWIVEDDMGIAEAIQTQAELWDMQVRCVRNFRNVMAEFADFDPHIVLLDISLPFFNGYHWCSEIRKVSKVPIIFISSASDNLNMVMAMNLGADDYIVKPFSPGEVMARIRAVLRRIPAAAEKEMLVIGELSIHLPSLSVTLSGHKLNLTRREVELLYTLAASPGRVFTRDNLLTIVWGYEFAGNYRAVDSHIKRLRAKLCDAGNAWDIKTVWGVGYRFEQGK